METSNRNRKIVWTGRVLSALVMLPFVMSAFMKLTMNPKVVEGMTHLGLPETMILPLGVIEALCIVIYAVPVTSILGAILFTGYMGGTIVTHWRVGEPVYAQIAIGVVIWLGLFLRESRLRALMPFRRTY